MKVPNLKGLGKNQQQTIKFLKEGCVLVHVQYYSDHTQIFSIEDKFDVFKEISLIEFNSLGRKEYHLFFFEYRKNSKCN